MFSLASDPTLPAPHMAAARSARHRFWFLLSDFATLRCSPRSWLPHCPPGHPFLHLDPATNTLILNLPAAATDTAAL